MLNAQAAALMGRIAEERIFKHYREDTGLHVPGSDFFDTDTSPDYVNFLLAQHSGLDQAKLRALGAFPKGLPVCVGRFVTRGLWSGFLPGGCERG